MKEFKEEHINPEQYWPEAEKLLENHYKAKRRRRAIVMFGAVLVGLLSVYFLSIERTNLAEKSSSNKKEKVNKVSEQNNIVIPSANEKITPSKESEVIKVKPEVINQNSIVKNEKEIAVVSPKNNNSSNKLITKKEKILVIVPNSFVQVSSSASSNSENAVISSSLPTSPSSLNSSNQVNQSIISNQVPPSDTKQNLNSIESPITVSNFGDVEYISSMPLLKWNNTTFEEASIQLDNRPELRNKKKAKWDVLLYAGFNDVQKELSGKSSASYLLRREKEEAPALLPFGGLQFSKSINNWDFRGGVEFAVLGEQVKYSPYTKGDYLSEYDNWIPNNYVVTDTDSAYIWGILFLNTTDYTVMDSVKVTLTDTLNGIYYNSNIRNANGTNRWYVMELPFEVLYQYRMKRWGIGISAGLAPGLVVQSSGYYLKEDESGYSSIKKYNKQQFTLNARAGIEISYLINTRCRLLLRPSSQYSITKMEAGAKEKQRYQRNGISVGLLYMIP